MNERERQLAFLVLRHQQALELANRILEENGLLGIIADTTNPPNQYEEDHITALIEAN